MTSSYTQSQFFTEKKADGLPSKAVYINTDKPTPIKILLVDDEPEFADLLDYVLTKEGYETSIAYNGIDALRQLQKEPVDILITDMRMPGISGTELLQSAREDYPWLQAIAVSAHEKPADAVELMRQGAIDFLQKPVSNDDLRLAVGAAADKVRLQHNLKKTTKELERVIASISDAIWSAELNSKQELVFSFMSPVIEKISGRKAEYYCAPYQSHLYTVHPEDLAKLESSINMLITGKQQQAIHEYRIVHTDGGLRWLQDDISIEVEESGKITLNGIISDITKRKNTEDLLIRSESFQKAVVDALPDTIFIQDHNGVFESCHAIDTSDLYSSPEQFLGHSTWEIFPNNMAHKFEQARVAAVQSGEVTTIEYDLPINGETMYFETRFVRMEPNHSLAVVRNITERKLAHQALKQSEELYRAIVRNSHDAIFIYDGKKIVFANDNLCQLLGYSEEEILNTDIRNVMHPEDQHSVADVDYDYNDRHFTSNYVARMLHKTKGVVACSITVSLTTYRNDCVALGTMRML